jgi:hypothetical protein
LPQRTDQPPTIDQAIRVKATLACSSLLRILHEAVRDYEGDLEGFVIYMSVACASVAAAMRNPEVAFQPKDAPPVSDTHFRPVSRRAIAASTGLPRETVRRKIAQMVERGFLVEERRGVRTRSGVLQERRNYQFAAVLMREIERSAAELARADRAFEAQVDRTFDGI